MSNTRRGGDASGRVGLGSSTARVLILANAVLIGVIVSDVAYGVVMLGVVVWLRLASEREPGLGMSTWLLGPAAATALLFGVLFGEFLGSIGSLSGMLKEGAAGLWWFGSIPTIDRASVARPLGYVALSAGTIAAISCFVLGVVNATRPEGRGQLGERPRTLTFVLSVMAVVGGVLALEECARITVQVASAVAAALGLTYAVRSAVVSVAETVDSAMRTSSYMRVMVAALAGVILADAASSVTALTGNQIAGAISGLVLHPLGFAVAAFSLRIVAPTRR